MRLAPTLDNNVVLSEAHKFHCVSWPAFLSFRHTDEMIQKLEKAGLGYHVKTEDTEDRLGTFSLTPPTETK